jgi:hypothetical protein
MKTHLLHSTLGIAFLFAACGPGSSTPGGSGGASPAGSGGASSGSGGASSSSGGAPSSSGGATNSGGASQSGGAPGTGGASSSSGGSSSGGATSGSGGDSTGGRGPGGASATGGRSGTGGRANTGGTTGTGGGAAGGNTTPGTCEKGVVKANDVVVLGESFYAMGNIVGVIQDHARAAGVIGANEKYRNLSVSGQPMSYIASTEWDKAVQGGVPKFIIMDGGGIDCLQGGCSTCSSQFKTLLTKMGTAGVKDVIYTRYPEPGAPPGSNTSLKACLDTVMPMMQPVCEASTSPKCHWVDLRPVWVAGDTTDGLHATQSGSKHVGDLIWSEMMKRCLAQ